jgi:uncharacterized protein (DUF3820 family)
VSTEVTVLPNMPIGKYRGQSLLTVAQDKNYVDWLFAQPWFVEKHKNIHLNIVAIVNNTGLNAGESCSREHNLLQLRFTQDKMLALSLAREFVGGQKFIEISRAKNRILAIDEKGLSELDKPRRLSLLQDFEGCPLNLEQWEARSELTVSTEVPRKRFFMDVVIRFTVPYLYILRESRCFGLESLRAVHYTTVDIDIELKPSLGDEYPQVLRKCHQVRVEHLPYRSMLIVEKYTGSVPLAAVQAMFREKYIDLRLLSEIEMKALT